MPSCNDLESESIGMPGWLAAALALAVVTLSGCGKPPAPLSFGPAAAAAAASARELAVRLVAHPFTASALVFSAGQATICDPAGAGEAYAWRCRVAVRDNQRGGQTTIVEVQLFDQDIDFAALKTPLTAHITSLDQNWTLDDAPDITFKSNRPGPCPASRLPPGAGRAQQPVLLRVAARAAGC